MKDQRTREIELAKVAAHPLRIEILTALEEGRASSPKELAQVLKRNVGDVSYHVKILREFKCVELIGEEPRRGAVEHYYRSSKALRLGADLSESQRELVAALLERALVNGITTTWPEITPAQLRELADAQAILVGGAS